MPTKKAWWVCNVCSQPITPVDSGRLQEAILAHKRMSCPKTTCSIKNLPQHDATK